MAGKQRSGKGSRITTGGVALNMAEWDVDCKRDDLDTTTFEDGGFETGLTGVEVCDGSAKGDWDAGRNFYDSPPGIFPQDSFGPIRCYENLADNVFWNFPTTRLLSTKNGAQVKQKVSFDFSWKSNGTYSKPTGSN